MHLKGKRVDTEIGLLCLSRWSGKTIALLWRRRRHGALGNGGELIEFQNEATGALNESGLRLVASKIEESPSPSGDNLFCRGYQIEEAVYLSDRIIGFAARPGRIKQIITIRLGHALSK
jgi:hypothetical protein